MSIRLEEINESNCDECVKLRVASSQEAFMTSTGTAIAHWKFHPDWRAFGIYEEDRMVGFAMYGTENNEDAANIISFMVDERYQGRGYGKAALDKLISLIRKDCKSKSLRVCIHPRDIEALRLYRQFGFQKKDITLAEEENVFYMLEVS